MSNRIAVSFEGETVKVVEASLTRGDSRTKKTLLFRNDELSAYLKNEKTGNFVVISDFQTQYQDTLFLPPVKDKYLRELAAVEIRKRAPELKDFSFCVADLGETRNEGRMVREVSVLAVANDELYRMIDRFEACGKTVDSLIPIALVLAQSAALSYSAQDQPVLCVAEAGPDKVLFLVHKGNTRFVRTVQSHESGIYDIDAENINMTVNFCRQTLKLNPARIVLFGRAVSLCNESVALIVPPLSYLGTSDIHTDVETFLDYSIPISALRYRKHLKKWNMLPKSYQNLKTMTAILTSCAALFLLLSLAGISSIWSDISRVLDMREGIRSMRTEVQRMEPVRARYEAQHREMGLYTPFISYMNTVNNTPDVLGVLSLLSFLGGPSMKEVRIQDFQVLAEGDAFKVEINGAIKTDSYKEMQLIYREIIERMQKSKEMELTSHSVDLKEKRFKVEGRYKPRETGS